MKAFAPPHVAGQPLVDPAHPAGVRASDPAQDALARLAYAHGPGERRAALLALLLTPGSRRERLAWDEATAGSALAERIAADVAALAPAARLPVFEALLERSRAAPLQERQALVETARAVMAADGHVGPLDRLRWLVMRHRLGDAPLASPRAGGAAQLSDAAAAELAVFSAFLARLLPRAEPDGGIGAAGRHWHARVLRPWEDALAPLGGARALCRAPDAERLLHALRLLQAQSWMLRPVMLGRWIEALPPPGVAALDADACDALRLAASLLEAPLPSALAARYVAPGWS